MFGVGVGYCSVDSVCLGLYLLIWLDDFGCGLLAGLVGVTGCLDGGLLGRSWWRCDSWCFAVDFWLHG